MFKPYESLNEIAAPKPLSLPHFIAWLGKQPAERTYNWDDAYACLLFFYQTEGCGIDRHPGWAFRDAPVPPTLATTFGDGFAALRAYQYVGATEPWTFGAAFERVKSL